MEDVEYISLNVDMLAKDFLQYWTIDSWVVDINGVKLSGICVAKIQLEDLTIHRITVQLQGIVPRALPPAT